MNRKLHLLLLVVLGLTLSACTSNGKPDPTVVETSGESTTNPANSYPYQYTNLTAGQLAEIGINGNPLDYTTLYFEYNSTAIDRRSEVIAQAHARSLAAKGGARVTLEGHADERGTRDYNLALGERRSQAVANLMAATGAGSTYNSVSYGEERPADPAHNESAWQKNRRVEISY